MSAAKSSLVYDADFEEVGEQRCGTDRRNADRRAAKQHADTLFVAILVNHVMPAPMAAGDGYHAPQRLRAGMAFDVRA
jgi:hypothetical protein